MVCESKRAFITSVVINVISFICLISIAIHFTNYLSYTADVNKVLVTFFISYQRFFIKIFYTQELNNKIEEQNETIVAQINEIKKNKTIVELNNYYYNYEIKKQSEKIDDQSKLIVDYGIEINNQNAKIEKLQNMFLGK